MPDHRLLPDGRLEEIAPDRCPNGHPWGPFQVLVGWQPCQCPGGRTRGGAPGHRTYSCRTCRVVVYRPGCQESTAR